MRIRILGCGDSGGVPRVGNDWGACDPSNPRNNRTRTSVAVEHLGETWLIDTSPDLRAQMLRTGLETVDGILFTHAHADHILGLDETRVVHFTSKKMIPIYGDAPTLGALRQFFGYLFQNDLSPKPPALYPQFLVSHEVAGPFPWLDQTVVPFHQDHGYSHSLGYRFKDWAYSTDVVHLDEAAFEALHGIRLWLVDCIDYQPKPSHSHLEQTLRWIERVQPKRAVLIHMSRLLDYDTLSRQLPPGVEAAYDGMVIDL